MTLLIWIAIVGGIGLMWTLSTALDNQKRIQALWVEFLYVKRQIERAATNVELSNEANYKLAEELRQLREHLEKQEPLGQWLRSRPKGSDSRF